MRENISKIYICIFFYFLCFALSGPSAQTVLFALVVCFELCVPLHCSFTQSCLRFTERQRPCAVARVCVWCDHLSLCAVAGQAPVVSVEPRTATVRQGQSASFRCSLPGGTSAQTTVEWKRANNQAMPGRERHHVSISIVHTTSPAVKLHSILFSPADNVWIGTGGTVLTVSNARPENQGQYHCVVTTSAGRGSATAALNVKCELVFTLT